MDTEAPVGSPPQRPRTSLLVALAVTVVLAFVAWRMGASNEPAGGATVASNAARPTAQGQGASGAIDPAMLAVDIEALEAERPAPGDSERNPFRFQPKAPPPPPEDAPVRPLPQAPTGPPPPPPPPPVPPIPLKFIGILESKGVGRIALFTDCRATFQVAEGQTIAGQYRLVSIGVESAVVEYINGKGRTTLRMGGQECVGK
jgi:hypothetical protein